MKTELLIAKEIIKDEKNIEYGAKLLREGELVVFPTETVYGLGANVFDTVAVNKIFVAKGRPQDNPLIVHIADFSQVYQLVSDIPESAKKLAEAFWPGPITIILPKSKLVSQNVSAGLETIAIRMPSHPIALELIKRANTPVAAPSANISGSPSPTTAQHSFSDLNGRVPLVLDGGACDIGLESTVVSLIGETPKILRPGAITARDIEKVLGVVDIDGSVFEQLGNNAKVSSPGMKYRHYAPKAEVVLVHGNINKFVSFVNKQLEENLWVMGFSEEKLLINLPFLEYGSIGNYNQQATNLFFVLRLLDEKGANKILVHAPQTEGVGLAVYNRLLRAASFRQLYLPLNDKMMSKFKIFGITGPTGSGKSSVSSMLVEKGYSVIDADEVTREVMSKGTPCVKDLEEFFGRKILNEDGTLNRRRLGNIAFSSKENTDKLNNITFPHIKKAIKIKFEQLENQGFQLAFLDAPTLIESGINKDCEKVITIIADADIRHSRIVSREPDLDSEQIKGRISAQPSNEFYIDNSDYIIWNNTTLKDLQKEVELVLTQLTL